jgi:hypothetical protein
LLTLHALFVTLIYNSVIQAPASTPLPLSNPRSKPKKVSKSHLAAAVTHSWAVGVQCLARYTPSPSPRFRHFHPQTFVRYHEDGVFYPAEIVRGAGNGR